MSFGHWPLFVQSIGHDADQVLGRPDVAMEFTVGECYATNGREIIVPRDVPERVMGEAMAAFVHERYGHGAYTDFAVVQRVGEEEGWLSEPLNITEDIRVDTRVIWKYPQYTEHYKDLLKYVEDKAIIQSGSLDKAREKMTPQVRVILELMWRGYPAEVNQGKPSFAADAGTAAWFASNSALVEEIYRVARDKKSKTIDSLGTARKLFQALYGDPPKQDPKKKPKKDCTCGCHQTGDFPMDYYRRAKEKGGQKMEE